MGRNNRPGGSNKMGVLKGLGFLIGMKNRNERSREV